MKKISCMAALTRKRQEGKFVSVGLDTDFNEISPEVVESLRRQCNLAPYGAEGPVMFAFNKAIIDATHDITACYKINPSFYEANGLQGLWALERTAVYLREKCPAIPWIFDRKYGDVRHAGQASMRYAFGILKAHAVTVNPFVGKEDGLDVFLRHWDKGIFVWCQSSNEGAQDFQFRERQNIAIACKVQQEWNERGNCGLIIGATHPDKIREIRKWGKDLLFLVPGIGAQQGDLEEAVKAAIYADPQTGTLCLPALFNSSRGIIFASSGKDFAEVARKKTIELNNVIKKVLKEAGA